MLLSDCSSAPASPHVKKMKLWASIVKQLPTTGGYVVSPDDCSDKWKNLKATYTCNKDKKSTSGHQAVTWEYFELMDEVLGQKASIEPSASQLFGSLPEQSQSQSQSQVTAESEPQPCSSKQLVALSAQSKPPTRTQPAATKRRASKQDEWMQKYVEQQEKRQAMWQEQKTLENSKITAINNLAAAINRLAGQPEQ